MGIELRMCKTAGLRPPVASSQGRGNATEVLVSQCAAFPSQPDHRPGTGRLAGALVQAGAACPSGVPQSGATFGEGVEALFRGALCAENKSPEERAERLLRGAESHLLQLDREFEVLSGKADLHPAVRERYLLGVCETLDGLVRELTELKLEASMARQKGGLPGRVRWSVRVPAKRIGQVQRACRNLVAQRWEQLAGWCPESFVQERADDSPHACVQGLMLTLRNADWRKTRGPGVLQLTRDIEKARMSRLLASERKITPDAMLACLEDCLDRYERAYRRTGNESAGVKPDSALQSAFRRGHQLLQSHCKIVLSGLHPDESYFSRQAKLTALDYRLQRRQSD